MAFWVTLYLTYFISDVLGVIESIKKFDRKSSSKVRKNKGVWNAIKRIAFLIADAL